MKRFNDARRKLNQYRQSKLTQWNVIWCAANTIVVIAVSVAVIIISRLS